MLLNLSYVQAFRGMRNMSSNTVLLTVGEIILLTKSILFTASLCLGHVRLVQ